jgi:dipeptidase E
VNPAVQVLGVPEGDWVRVRGDHLLLAGPKPARWCRAGHTPADIAPGVLPVEFRVRRATDGSPAS